MPTSVGTVQRVDLTWWRDDGEASEMTWIQMESSRSKVTPSHGVPYGNTVAASLGTQP